MEIQWIRGTTILWNKRSSRSELAYVPNSTRVRARTPSRACNAISRAFSSANAQCKLQCDPYKCTSTIVTSNVVARFPFAPLPRLTVNFTTFDFDSRSQTLRLSPDFSPLLPGLAPAAVPLFLPFFLPSFLPSFLSFSISFQIPAQRDEIFLRQRSSPLLSDLFRARSSNSPIRNSLQVCSFQR